jgi:Terpene cyclase DEP1
MTDRSFRASLVALAVTFTIVFVVLIPPALIRDGFDFWGAARDTFVNPYASGVSVDVLMSYAVLVVWVFHEARTRQVRRGWIALALGLVTGLTVGLVAYLLIRLRQTEIRPTR